MKRTTVRLDDDLLRQAKEVAARSGRTLRSVLEDALREFLSRSESHQPRARVRVRIPTYGRGGVRPGVDLDGDAGLLDLMESTSDPG